MASKIQTVSDIQSSDHGTFTALNSLSSSKCVTSSNIGGTTGLTNSAGTYRVKTSSSLSSGKLVSLANLIYEPIELPLISFNISNIQVVLYNNNLISNVTAADITITINGLIFVSDYCAARSSSNFLPQELTSFSVNEGTGVQVVGTNKSGLLDDGMNMSGTSNPSPNQFLGFVGSSNYVTFSSSGTLTINILVT